MLPPSPVENVSHRVSLTEKKSKYYFTLTHKNVIFHMFMGKKSPPWEIVFIVHPTEEDNLYITFDGGKDCLSRLDS